MGALIDLTGEEFGSLTVTARAGTADDGATWHVVCSCGATCTKRGTYLRRGTTKSCGDRRMHPPAPRVIGVNNDYHNVHSRLRQSLGSASAHECFICGAPAQEWAFLGCDEQVVGRSGTGAYCVHACPSEYAPACIPCHRSRDAHQEG